MSGHTTGPWADGYEAILVKIDRDRPWASTVFRRNYDGSEANALVAMTFGGSMDEAIANARLIAAAPALLEENEKSILALDEAAKILEGRGLGGSASIMRQRATEARAAIAQARGDAA